MRSQIVASASERSVVPLGGVHVTPEVAWKIPQARRHPARSGEIDETTTDVAPKNEFFDVAAAFIGVVGSGFRYAIR